MPRHPWTARKLDRALDGLPDFSSEGEGDGFYQAQRPRVGDPPGLGRAAGATGAARGILVAALGVLAAHFGYGEAKRAS